MGELKVLGVAVSATTVRNVLRRAFLRGHTNILKRLLIHTGAFNLGLLMRQLIGVGTPPESPGPARRGAQRAHHIDSRLLALCDGDWPSRGRFSTPESTSITRDATPRSALARIAFMQLGDPLDAPVGVRCAWHRLVASRGRSSIASIVQEVGWSQRHFVSQFKHEIGVSPKVFARMLRFGRVVRAIRAGQTADLADLALASG